MDKIKKILITNIAIIASVVTMGAFALNPINYVVKTDASNWMSKLNKNTKITELSIPGSHDSGATHSILDIAGKCQDLSIVDQLNIGVRYFDIRLQLVSNEFEVVHSFVQQNLKFESVMNDISNFVRDNPYEFVFLSIKEEVKAISSNKKFEDVLKTDLSKYEPYISYEDTLPETVWDARGKIHLLSRYKESTIGVPSYNGWKDDDTFIMGDFYIQDNYDIGDVEDKKEDILETIDYSINHNDKLVLNFTSAVLDGDFPPSYSGGAAKVINPWLVSELKDKEGSLGVMVMDFVTSTLCDAVIGRNK